MTHRRGWNVLGGTACAVAVGAAAALAAIDQIAPTSGTIGTSIVIDGSGFGTNPKAFLTNVVDDKKYPLKVTAKSDTQVTALVKKAIAGDYTVSVQPKGEDAFVSAVNFTTVVPQITDVNPTSFEPKGSATVNGSLFGTRSRKKSKVLVGGKKAKITSWTDAAIAFVAHKKTPAGTQDLVVLNSVGQGVQSVEVTDPDAGGGGGNVHEDVGGRLVGNPINDNLHVGDDDVEATYDAVGKILTITATDVVQGTNVTLVLTAHIDVDSNPTNESLEGADADAIYTRDGTQVFMDDSSEFEIIIQRVKDGVIDGRAQGRLNLTSGGQGPTYLTGKIDFRVTKP